MALGFSLWLDYKYHVNCKIRWGEHRNFHDQERMDTLFCMDHKCKNIWQAHLVIFLQEMFEVICCILCIFYYLLLI
ncbi:hypothetical protein CsSME_00036541 [Camellia sinensis var. sinensis]